MDDEAAIRAHRAAAAAAAWLNAPRDHTVYTRMVKAVDHWQEYESPRLELADNDGDLVDEIAGHRSPQPLGAGIPALEATMRERARQAL